MSVEIKAPIFPESVADGTVATWHKKPGEAVKRDELIVDIETDKVVLEVLAPADGVISNVLKQEGDTVLSQETLATFTEGAAATASAPEATAPAASTATTASAAAGPAARKAAAESGVSLDSIEGSGKGGRVTKADVQGAKAAPAPAAAAPVAAAPAVSLAVGERVEKRVPMTRLRAKVAEREAERAAQPAERKAA